ncbi:Hypothetical protein, putative [Bodo saltans]|uniref:Uncharacterized protein n=1 Tax=Bodo saltans TaxID=75058 RepID=A0A0S4JE99_BODSA|nr:Hypothetical protein, putative [Bodo saltans]|eukprot:CUG88492.1 Hypothetical protein, putative [Bodo saltans]
MTDSTSYVSPLAIVQLTTQRLRAKLSLLDTIGISAPVSTTNISSYHHHATTTTATSSSLHHHDPRSATNMASRQHLDSAGGGAGLYQLHRATPVSSSYAPQLNATASVALEVRSSGLTVTSGQARSTEINKASNVRIVPQQKARGQSRDPPLMGLRQQETPAAMIRQPADHNLLISSVMKDFGFDYETAKRLPRPGSTGRSDEGTTATGSSTVDESGVVGATRHTNAQRYEDLKTPSMNVSSVAGGGVLPGGERDDETTFDDTGYVVGPQHGGRSQGNDDEIPRPQTPPHPHQSNIALARHHDPNVLIVSGFEADEGSSVPVVPQLRSVVPQQNMKATVEISREGLQKRKPQENTLAASDAQQKPRTASASRARSASADHSRRLGPSASSPLGPATFSSTAISDLLSKTNTGLSAAKRDELFAVAQRAYEGIVGTKHNTSAIYRNYPNLCRQSEKNRPPTVASNSLKSAAPTPASVNTSKFERGGSANTGGGSPPRWPRRVISDPYVTSNLQRGETQVRHVSAPRRALHPSAVKGLHLQSSSTSLLRGGRAANNATPSRRSLSSR